MPERFLYDILREAPRPRRRRWLDAYWWTVPAGICFGVGLYALTFGRMPATGVGFLAAGVGIAAVFKEAE